MPQAAADLPYPLPQLHPAQSAHLGEQVGYGDSASEWPQAWSPPPHPCVRMEIHKDILLKSHTTLGMEGTH